MFSPTGGSYNGAQTDTTPDPPKPDYSAQFKGLLADATNTANTGYQNTLADSLANEASYALGLGATLGARDPSLDPSVATSGSFDWNNVQSTNPFSKAALLVRSYQQGQGRIDNSYASQGQLYSGARVNAQDENTFGYQQGQNTLQQALLDYLTGQSRVRRDAAGTRDQTVTGTSLEILKGLLGGNGG